MVAAAVELVFVASHAVMEGNFAGQAALRQKLQGAIHRGESDLGIFFSRQAEQFVGGEVIARLEKGAKNGIALVRVLQAYALEMLVEYLLCLARGFPCGRSMIVNSSLQHVGISNFAFAGAP